jgi:hypothetical protein
MTAQKISHLVTKTASSPKTAYRHRRFRNIPHLLATLALASCATDGPDPIANRRGRVTNAILTQVGTTVFKVALASFTACQNDRQIDRGHAIASGLWTEAPTLISASSIAAIVDAYSDDHAPKIATAAAAAFASAPTANTRDKIAVINTIADAISSAALLAGTAKNFPLPTPTPK